MTSHAVDELVVLQPSGDFLEGAACDELEHELYSLAEQGRRVIVDLSHTRVLTAHCLGLLARGALLAGDWRWAQGFQKQVDAVTAADVQGYAKKHIGKLQTVLLGDPAKLDPALATSL